MAEQWSGFSHIVTNLARFIRPDEITFSGVNSTMPMLACLLAKRAYDWDYVYINVAGGGIPGLASCRRPAPIRCWPNTRRRSSPTRISTICARVAAWT